MTDLLSLLLRQLSQEVEASTPDELNAALQERAHFPAGQGSQSSQGQSDTPSASTALLLEEEYQALRQAAPVLQLAEAATAALENSSMAQAAPLIQQLWRLAEDGYTETSNERLIIKERKSDNVIAPSELDRLFERDARRYDNGFTLY